MSGICGWEKCGQSFNTPVSLQDSALLEKVGDGFGMEGMLQGEDKEVNRRMSPKLIVDTPVKGTLSLSE